jgi:thiol-disulfide isomerase/thioredoxin
MKRLPKHWLIIFVTLFIVAPFGYHFYSLSQPGKLDTFAQCLSDKGAKFYGAFWCPHCQEQKKDFGKSAKLLPYIECSAPNGKDQLQVCTDAGVTGYPTWMFADGSKETGRVALAKLAEKTGCTLAQ